MPHATSKNKPSKRHHHRRYTWPPCEHLIDVSKIQVPLPEIDEDPFSHFLAKEEPTDDDEYVVYTAGILPTEQCVEPPTHAEKAFRFRTSISRRWKKFWDRYRAKLHSRRSTEAARHIKAPEVEEEKSPSIPHRTSSRNYHRLSEPSQLSRPDPTPVQREYSRPATGHRRQHSSPSPRRSWHAPSPVLYSITETLDEEEDA